jgi:hypothetical protein
MHDDVPCGRRRKDAHRICSRPRRPNTWFLVRSRALEKATTRAVRRPPIATAQLAQVLGILGVIRGQMRESVETHGGGVIPAREVQETMLAFRDAAEAILRTLGKRPALSKDTGA